MAWKGSRFYKDITLLAVFIAVLTFVSFKYGPRITELAHKPDEFRSVILGHGYFGVVIFISIQIVQIVVAAIPGELIQVAGGYIYGVWFGTLYLVIGVLAGSFIAFYAARLLGYSLIKKIMSEDKLIHFHKMMESKKAYRVIAIVFLLPGLPKDFFVYAGGLTPVKPRRFIGISTLARIPALFVSAYIGENIQGQYYTKALIYSLIALAAFVIVMINRERIFHKFNK